MHRVFSISKLGRLVAIICVLSTTAEAQVAKHIAAVDSAVKKIDNNINLRTIAIENEEILKQTIDGGSEITGYCKDRVIKKMSEVVYLSSCVLTTETYFADSNDLFVFQEERVFAFNDSSNTFDYSQASISYTAKAYLVNDKIESIQINGSPRCSDILSSNNIVSFLTELKRKSNILLEK